MDKHAEPKEDERITESVSAGIELCSSPDFEEYEPKQAQKNEQTTFKTLINSALKAKVARAKSNSGTKTLSAKRKKKGSARKACITKPAKNPAKAISTAKISSTTPSTESTKVDKARQ